MDGICAGREFYNGQEMVEMALQGWQGLILGLPQLGHGILPSHLGIMNMDIRHQLGKQLWGLLEKHAMEERGFSDCPAVAQWLNKMIFILLISWQTNGSLSSILDEDKLSKWDGVAYSIFDFSWPCLRWPSSHSRIYSEEPQSVTICQIHFGDYRGSRISCYSR